MPFDIDDAPCVTLAPREIAHCVEVARMRHAVNERRGIRDRATGMRPAGANPHLLGAIGECAFHLWLRLPWMPDLDRPSYDGDALGWIEIKCAEGTERCPYPRLVAPDMETAKRRAMLDRAFVLVIWTLPVATIAGWTFGRTLLAPERFADHFASGRPCWALALDALRPMDTLAPFLRINGGAVAEARWRDEYFCAPLPPTRP